MDPMKQFEDFLNFIKFWEPPCILIDWESMQLGEKLGSGSYGAVRKAKIQNFSKDITVKIIPNIDWDDINDVERLIREIQILHSCDHPNILPLYGLAINRKKNPIQIGILTPLKWGSLRQLIELAYQGQANEQKLPKGTIFNNETKQKIIFGISAGLLYLSSKKIIHRDIKLENILLDDNLNPLICDFGFAKQNISKSSNMIQSGVLGTPLYTAPEIVMGKEDYSEKADIYSWSIVVNSILQEELPSIQMIPDSENCLKTQILPKLIEGEEYKLYRELIEQSKMFTPKERPSANEIIYKLLKKEAMLSNVNEISIQQYQREVLSNIPVISVILFQKIDNLENENVKLIQAKNEQIKNMDKLRKKNRKLVQSQNEQINKLQQENNEIKNQLRIIMNKLNDCQMPEQKSEYKTENTNQQNVTQKEKENEREKNQHQITQEEIDKFNARYEKEFNHKNDSEFTKLHFAAEKNSKEIGEFLISKGADINAKDIIISKYYNIIFCKWNLNEIKTIQLKKVKVKKRKIVVIIMIEKNL